MASMTNMPSESKSTVFLLSWDMLGLEACINLSEQDKQEMWAALTDGPAPPSLSSTVQAILLRARYNAQRHYEVYTIHVAPEISECDLRQMFEDSPQTAADLIRSRGVKIYSDRIKKEEVKIV